MPATQTKAAKAAAALRDPQPPNPSLRLIATPDPTFTGERVGLQFVNGIAAIDPEAVRPGDGRTYYDILTVDLGYDDVTPVPEPEPAD